MAREAQRSVTGRPPVAHGRRGVDPGVCSSHRRAAERRVGADCQLGNTTEQVLIFEAQILRQGRQPPGEVFRHSGFQASRLGGTQGLGLEKLPRAGEADLHGAGQPARVGSLQATFSWQHPWLATGGLDRMVLSSLPEANVRPSAEKATASIPEW